MKRICLVLVSLILVLAILSGCNQSIATTIHTTTTATTRPTVDPVIDRTLFSGSGSYASLVKAIEETISSGGFKTPYLYNWMGGPQRSAADASEGSPAPGGFSTTNVQVAGIDEADIVKTDGRYLYYVANNRLYIVDMMAATPKVVFTHYFDPSVESGDKTSGENPVELFLDIPNKRLVVLVNGFLYENQPPIPVPEETRPAETVPGETKPDSTTPDSSAPAESGTGQDAPGEASTNAAAPDETITEPISDQPPTSRIMMPYYNHKSYTITRIYSIENPEAPKLVRQFTQEGGYMTSRLMDGHLYVLSNKYEYMYRYYGVPVAEDALKAEEILPKTTDDPVNGDWTILPPDRIGLVPDSDPNAQVIISAISLTQDSKKPELLSLLGASGVVYASRENIYLANYAYVYNEKEPEKSTSDMKIYRVGIREGQITANCIGQVPGTIINQFAMDEHQGYFRIATTDSGAFWGRGDSRSSSSTVYVLDKNLKVIGQVGKLGPGETIRSVRFMGDQAYVVTFKTTDPLYVLDMKTPTEPRVLGELKIPGFSTYLHPYGENLLLGFGFDAIVEGENAFQSSLKVSLFDISDLSNPKERSTILLGGMGSYTELAHNHKALLFDREKNLIAFPATLTGENASRTKEAGMLFQGLVVMSVEEDSKLVLRGGLSNSDKLSSLKGDGIPYSKLTQADQMALYGYDSVTRGLYIGDRLITLSGRLIRQYSLADLERIGSVSLKGYDEFYGGVRDLIVTDEG